MKLTLRNKIKIQNNNLYSFKLTVGTNYVQWHKCWTPSNATAHQVGVSNFKNEVQNKY